ncbi:MAG: DUF599 domain-containing protein [Pseudomonadota bacterium]
MLRAMLFDGPLAALTVTDVAAVVALFLTWLGLGYWIDTVPVGPPSVTRLMSDYRRRWMHEMVTRQPRIYDATVLNGLRQGTAFFASSSLIAIGGALALIGNTEQLMGAATELGDEETATVVWQLKLCLVVVFLANAFLKFVWANRIFGYCAVVMSAVPNEVSDTAYKVAAQAAEINIRAAINFNRGLRSMYFALAAVTWVIGPLALGAATAIAAYTIWQREFVSRPRAILKGDTAE